jgi:hypothetical protein
MAEEKQMKSAPHGAEHEDEENESSNELQRHAPRIPDV